MIGFLLLAILSAARGSGIPWYPYFVPIHTAANHRHTTHIITHPIVHTRVFALGEDQRHHHNHGHGHLHQHGPHQQLGYSHLYYRNAGYPHRETAVFGRSNGVVFPKSEPYKTQARHPYPDSYQKYRYGYQKEENQHSEPDIRYSMPVEESPWKPLTNLPYHVPKGYMPLKYLGLDEKKVVRVVQDAMNEIDHDIEAQPKPRYPTGIQDLIGPQVKPLPATYRGAVFYDEDDAPRDGHVPTGPVTSYYMQNDSTRKKGLKMNLDCHCETPYSN